VSRRFDRSKVALPRRPAIRPPAAGRFGRRIRIGSWARRSWALRRPLSWRSPVRRPGAVPTIPANPLARLRLRIPGSVPRSVPGRALSVAAALVLFAAGTWVAARSALLDVDHIEVTGAFQVPVAEAVEASGIRTGLPLLAIDRPRAEARLEALPWVRSARVERAFPNRVSIRLRERQVAASVARPAGGFALLDASGRVLADRRERPDGIPEIRGAGAVPAPGRWLRPARAALGVVFSLPEPLRGRVVSASVEGEAVRLWVGGIEVRYGPPDQLEAKAAALSALLDHLGGRPVAYLDLRVPGAPVVGPAGPSPHSSAPAPPAPKD
jgi:cell division protein FtsQ